MKFVKTILVNKISKRVLLITLLFAAVYLLTKLLDTGMTFVIWASVAVFAGGAFYYGFLIHQYLQLHRVVNTALIGLFYNSVIATLGISLIAQIQSELPSDERLLSVFSVMVFYYAWIAIIIAFEGSKE